MASSSLDHGRTAAAAKAFVAMTNRLDKEATSRRQAGVVSSCRAFRDEFNRLCYMCFVRPKGERSSILVYDDAAVKQFKLKKGAKVSFRIFRPVPGTVYAIDLRPYKPRRRRVR